MKLKPRSTFTNTSPMLAATASASAAATVIVTATAERGGPLDHRLRRLRSPRRSNSFGTMPILFHRCLRIASIATVLVIISIVKDLLLERAQHQAFMEDVEFKTSRNNVTLSRPFSSLVSPPSSPVAENVNVNRSNNNNNNKKPSKAPPSAKPHRTKRPTAKASNKKTAVRRNGLNTTNQNQTILQFNLSSSFSTGKDAQQQQQLQRDLFAEMYCQLEGTNDWLPADQTSWKWRAPAAVMAGSHATGIRTLMAQLVQRNNHVLPTRHSSNVQFFQSHAFKKFMTRQGKVNVATARQRMWSRNYPVKALESNDNTITIDATEGYLFHSTTVPIRLLCTCPWIKLIVILRNPVDRLWEHYQEFRKNHNLRVSLEDWIAADLQILQKVGLIQDPKNNSIDKMTVDEDEAYALYLQTAMEGPIGHGLYEIQLRQWLVALQAMGRDLKTSVLILRLEEWETNPNGMIQHVVEFLGLPPNNTTRTTKNNTTTTTTTNRQLQLVYKSQGSSFMDPDTRLKLETLYAPFNNKLYHMLGWQDVWKASNR